MANIKPYTDQIKKAVFGEEVRGSIVGAIEAIDGVVEAEAEKAAASAAEAAESAELAAKHAEQAKDYTEESRQAIQEIDAALEEERKKSYYSSEYSKGVLSMFNYHGDLLMEHHIIKREWQVITSVDSYSSTQLPRSFNMRSIQIGSIIYKLGSHDLVVYNMATREVKSIDFKQMMIDETERSPSFNYLYRRGNVLYLSTYYSGTTGSNRYAHLFSYNIITGDIEYLIKGNNARFNFNRDDNPTFLYKNRIYYCISSLVMYWYDIDTNTCCERYEHATSGTGYSPHDMFIYNNILVTIFEQSVYFHDLDIIYEETTPGSTLFSAVMGKSQISYVNYTPSTNRPRMVGASRCIIGNKLYLYGNLCGSTNTNKPTSNNRRMMIVNLDTRTITASAPMLDFLLSGTQLVPVDDRYIYICGGIVHNSPATYTDEKYLANIKNVYIYDTETNTIIEELKDKLTYEHYLAASGTYNGDIAIVSGAASSVGYGNEFLEMQEPGNNYIEQYVKAINFD